MPHFICVTCGTQFAETDKPPDACAVCEDERQYVGWSGQQWTTLDELERSHRGVVRLEELGLFGIGMEPAFAIGQRALLVTRPEGNVLWDCIPLVDPALVEMIRGIGGVAAIAVSHPHYYASMVEWSRAFDCPIFLHADDRQWVMRPDPAIRFWESETQEIGGGLTLIRCGGHFDGGTVLFWPDGADGRGAILSGDILQVVQDRRWVSFMYSYPNLIPLPAAAVERIVRSVEPFAFDRIYGAWWGRTVFTDAKEAVRRSAQRYLRAIGRQNESVICAR
jgi:glyoxylase-like metal-dependent hydrolase (beta-lactamase superfamily II)